MDYHFAATLVLLGALAYLWLEVRRLGRVVLSLEERIARPAPASTPASPPVAVAAPAATIQSAAPVAPVPAPAGIEPGVLAALAAAVAVMVRGSHRIVAVQADGGAQRAWSAEGRREIYHSHRVR